MIASIIINVIKIPAKGDGFISQDTDKALKKKIRVREHISKTAARNAPKVD